jgi:hypothetical protein
MLAGGFIASSNVTPETWRTPDTWPVSSGWPPSPTPFKPSARPAGAMREEFTRDRLRPLMNELARTAPRRGSFQVFFVGGTTAVAMGWRRSSVDVDLFSEQDAVFRDIQGIKERLRMNVEFARPEDFVPPLTGAGDRHLFIEKVGPISYFHYDPYSQILSKIVRGFQKDLEDARAFLREKLVEPDRFRSLVRTIPDSTYAKYPRLSRAAVETAVDRFLADERRS